MRIGVDAHSVMRLPRCGMHHHTFEILRQLTSQPQNDRYLLFFDEKLRSDPQLDRRFLEELGSGAEPVPLRTVGPTGRTAQLAWLRWHLPRAIVRHQVDVFHGFSHLLPYTRRCPMVLTVHDLMPHELLSWTHRDPVAIRRRRALISGIRRATGVCAVSSATQADVLAVDPGKAQTLQITPNAVRKALGRVASTERLAGVQRKYGLPARFLLTIGADTPRRNYARLIDGVAAASGADLAPLVIVGETAWETSRAFRRAAEAKVRDRILFLSSVSDDELAALYTLAATYICPSIHEGFAMPVLEAFACGTPVICSDLAVLHELAGGLADYFDPTSPRSIGAALVRASMRQPCEAAQREVLVNRSQQFSWRTSANAVHGLYRHLIDAKYPRLESQGLETA